MKITVVGTKNHYNLEEYAIRALKSQGHSVQFLGYNEINRKEYSTALRMITTRSYIFRKLSEPFWLKSINNFYRKSIDSFRPEIVLSLKGESLLPSTINYITKDIGAISALWFPDDPRFFNSLTKHIAPYYNAVFSYSDHALENYHNIGVKNAHRLHFGCDSFIHKREHWDSPIIKKAVFVGTFTPNRFRVLKKLIKNGSKIDIFGRYWKYFLPSNTISGGIYGTGLTKVFQKYIASINIHNDINYGPNMRTFEVTGSGGLLLTDHAEDIENFFKDGKEALIYRDVGELAKIIREVTNGDALTSEIAKNGYIRAHNCYSYESVMKSFIHMISNA